jgi:excisionase family DNA binding protein
MENPESEKPLCLDVSEVAALLGIAAETAYQSCRRGDLPCIRLGGRRLRVPTAAVEKILGHPLDPAHLIWASEQVLRLRERQRGRRHRAVSGKVK